VSEAGTTAHAVVVRNVSKSYRIGVSKTETLYDRVAHRARPSGDGAASFWALRDVTFSVPRGQVLGVLGRNGSGKSTLMKIIARVTSPTSGSILAVGRVGALLQVGTGFHPDLTGRDNIALSGAILGMGRDEVASAFPSIIDFAEVDEFLDTPVRYYSSGMYLRLAFSVAAFMPADIMIIDEVLSVGDAPFQRKCQARIRQLVDESRTVLFVSHNLASVRALCDMGVVLHMGRLVFAGTAEESAKHYENEVLRP
jgi:lipopolysaccharide transport system ATP-binding protein